MSAGAPSISWQAHCDKRHSHASHTPMHAGSTCMLATEGYGICTVSGCHTAGSAMLVIVGISLGTVASLSGGEARWALRHHPQVERQGGHCGITSLSQVPVASSHVSTSFCVPTIATSCAAMPVISLSGRPHSCQPAPGERKGGEAS